MTDPDQFDALVDEYTRFCMDNGLDPLKGADEQRPASAAIRCWLADFIIRWDAAWAAEDLRRRAAALAPASVPAYSEPGGER